MLNDQSKKELELEKAHLLALYNNDEVEMFREIIEDYFENNLPQYPVIEYISDGGTDG